MKREYFGYVFAVALLAGLWTFALNRGGRQAKEPTLAEQIAAYEAAYIGSPQQAADLAELRRVQASIREGEERTRNLEAYRASYLNYTPPVVEESSPRVVYVEREAYSPIYSNEPAQPDPGTAQLRQLAAEQAALRAQLRQEAEERKALQFQQEQNAASQQRKIRQIEQERNWEWVNSHPARGK